MKIKKLLALLLTLTFVLTSSNLTYASNLDDFWLQDKTYSLDGYSTAGVDSQIRAGSVIVKDSGDIFVGVAESYTLNEETDFYDYTYKIIVAPASQSYVGEWPEVQWWEYALGESEVLEVDNLLISGSSELKNMVYDGERYVYFCMNKRNYNYETHTENPETIFVIRYDIETNTVEYKQRNLDMIEVPEGAVRPTLWGGSRIASVSYIDGKITGDVFDISNGNIGEQTVKTYTYDYETNDLQIFDTGIDSYNKQVKSALVFNNESYLYYNNFDSGVIILSKINNITKEEEIIYSVDRDTYTSMVVAAFDDELFFATSNNENYQIISYNFRNNLLSLSDVITDYELISRDMHGGEALYTHGNKLYIGNHMTLNELSNNRTSYKLTGSVKNQFGNTVDDVTVKILSNGNELSAQTNSEGQFVFNTSTLIGNSILVLSKDGYEEKSIDINFNSTLDLGDITLNKLFFQVTGVVKDTFNNTIHNARVTILGNSVLSDELGRYKMNIPITP